MDINYLCLCYSLFFSVLFEVGFFCGGVALGELGVVLVCITAIEMSARVTLRFDLLANKTIAEPCLRTKGPLCGVTSQSAWFATTANGPDLFECSQRAVRYMIDHIVSERGLNREEAYVLCSVCVDLKINEIVDAPNWIVSAFLPEIVFN